MGTGLLFLAPASSNKRDGGASCVKSEKLFVTPAALLALSVVLLLVVADDGVTSFPKVMTSSSERSSGIAFGFRAFASLFSGECG